MAAILQHKHYHPGDPIFRKGDPGDFLYLVERGSVINRQRNDDRRD